MSKRPKYMIDGEYASPTKKDDPPKPPESAVESDIEQSAEATVTNIIEEIKAKQTKTAETLERVRSSAENRARKKDKDRLDEERLAEIVSQESVSANLQHVDRPVSLGGKPKKGSAGEALLEQLEASENWIRNQRENLRLAGREMGQDAQQALQKQDYLEAALKGAAAFSARAGAGIIDASTILRPIALREMFSVVGATAVDVAQHPEKIPESVATTIKNVAQDPGSLVEFGFGLAGDYALGLGLSELGRQAGIVQTSVSRLDDLKISVDADSLRLIEEFDPITGKAYTAFQTPDAEISGMFSSRRIPSEVAEIMAEELGDQAGSMRLLGVATEDGITAIDRIELPLSQSQFDDLMSGKIVKNIDDITVERLGLGSEKIFSVEDLADDLLISSDDAATIFGKTDDALAIDAKELGPSMNVFDEDAIKTTTIQTIDDLDTISIADDPLAGKKIDLIEGQERVVIVEETTGSIKISEIDESVPFNLHDDFIITDEVVKKGKKFTSEVDEGTRFGGPWGDEGTEFIIEEGEIRYDIKGQILEESVDDALEGIPHLEPQEGDPTPWAFTHKQPGYTDALRDLPDALKQDIDIIKELTGGEVDSPFFGTHDLPSETILEDITEGVAPVVKITEDPINIDTRKLFVSRSQGPPGQFDADAPPGLFADYPTGEDMGTMPNPYFGKSEKTKKDKDETDSSPDDKLLSDDYLDKVLRDKERKNESEISDESDKIIDDIDEDLFNDQDDDTDEDEKKDTDDDQKLWDDEDNEDDDIVTSTLDFKQKLIDIPIVIPKPIPKQTPKQIPKPTQKQTPDEPLDPTTPDFPELIYLTHKPRVKKPPKKRGKSRLLEPIDPFGFEERKYGVLTPDEMLSLGKNKKSTKGLFIEAKSKKKRKNDLWL